MLGNNFWFLYFSNLGIILGDSPLQQHDEEIDYHSFVLTTTQLMYITIALAAIGIGAIVALIFAIRKKRKGWVIGLSITVATILATLIALYPPGVLNPGGHGQSDCPPADYIAC